MARYTGPMTRKSRRLKTDLVGGDQAFERRPYPPGQHGRIRIKETEYLLQLQEKQKARTRRMARQLVNHGHFTVNGKNVDIPSYKVSQYDVIDVREKSRNTDPFVIARELYGDRPVPAWLQVVPNTLRILVHQLPERAQIDTQVTEQLIVEFYSK